MSKRPKIKIVAELPLDEVLQHTLNELTPFQFGDRKHIKVMRLKQFAVHGCKCHFCGLKGNIVLVTEDGGHGLHADVFHRSDEHGLVMMNRDHITPASLGGGNNVWNMRPTCEPCNTNRGNTYTDADKEQVRFNSTWAKWNNKLWSHGSKRIWLGYLLQHYTITFSEKQRLTISRWFAKLFH